ncbi:DoxX family membrane protein [Acidiferrimicrobium sp. IK]|uniref:DoxX family protein n=1 Tax=Acidiferrimicrobium sp. IK TaxID=2871700 RepID=UPI0021CB13F3|nr:DoxX family membrane protein [Acidiferrimicrobium sp. IK]MCU4185318.1 DoxX family membrane protein [Acidiferrimicrobium sp. IK]
MSLIRRVARPMLASVFVVGGVQTARNPGAAAKKAEPVALPIAERVPGLPTDSESLVRINAVTQVGAGVLLATGRLRRLSSLALFSSLVLTTAAGHPFWQEQDEALRRQHLMHFLKNVGLGGGLLLSLVDTNGAPSLGWRARRRAERAGAALHVGRDAAAGAIHSGRDSAGALLARTADALPVG